MPPARFAFWAGTLVAIVLTFRSVVIAPPAFPIAVGLTAAYVGLAVSGVLLLRLRMFCDAVVRGPADARGVALTFDDGPDPVHTRAVLDVLDARGVKATFFVIGRKVERHPELVREILARGHDVGLHGYAHDRLFSLRRPRRVRADLTRASRVVEAAAGRPIRWFRPPIGHTNPTIARIADAMELTVVGWSVAARDGLARTTPRAVLSRVRSGLRDGAIVLLHDAAEHDDRAPAGVAALPAILDAAAEKNLPIVPLRGWVETAPDEEPGAVLSRREP